MEQTYEKLNFREKPRRTKWWLQALLWSAVPASLIGIKHKIVKTNFKRIKGGCLLLSNHMCFEDFKLMERIIFPRYSYYITSIDEFVGKEKILRDVGCIPKKVHYRDMALVRNIVRLLKSGNIVTIYPEATYSFAGITNTIDQSLGKLAKMANVQVIVINQKGNYLFSPRWNCDPHNKEVPLIATASIIASSDEVKELSADEIQSRINEAFIYDDYKYQRENNIRIIKNKTKAHNIHRILYKCPHCLKESQIEGHDNTIECKCCGASYDIDELSIIRNKNGETKFDSISDWFKWQRQFVVNDINSDAYHITFPVKISRFLNAKLGFDHDYAKGEATQTNKGIVVTGTTKDGEPFSYTYDEKENATIHLTFDVKGCQESAFEVHNAEESYLVYPLDGTPIIKIRFAVEASHELFLKNCKAK